MDIVEIMSLTLAILNIIFGVALIIFGFNSKKYKNKKMSFIVIGLIMIFNTILLLLRTYK